MHKEAKLTLPYKGQMSMYDHYFSNFGSSPVPEDICKDSAIRHAWFWRIRFLMVFPIQMHREANLTLPLKGQTSTYDNSFSNFGRTPVPNDSCKDSAPRHSRFWRRRFFKVFTIYGRDGHLGQWTATILAIFCSPTLRRLHMKFEQNWLSGFRGEVVSKC